MLINVSIAFVVFCMAASAIYLVNDVRDVEADRQHPTKRFRPIAAGVVPEWLAYTLAVVLGVASLAISWFVTSGPDDRDGRIPRQSSWRTASA